MSEWIPYLVGAAAVVALQSLGVRLPWLPAPAAAGPPGAAGLPADALDAVLAWLEGHQAQQHKLQKVQSMLAAPAAKGTQP